MYSPAVHDWHWACAFVFARRTWSKNQRTVKLDVCGLGAPLGHGRTPAILEPHSTGRGAQATVSRSTGLLAAGACFGAPGKRYGEGGERHL